MENGIIGLVLLVLGLLAGFIFKGERNKVAQAKQEIKRADTVEAEGVKNAQRKLEERVVEIRAEARAEVASRPVTSDPVADLADRIARHRSRRQRP
jgi:hypothetical protein